MASKGRQRTQRWGDAISGQADGNPVNASVSVEQAKQQYRFERSVGIPANGGRGSLEYSVQHP